MEEKLTIHLEHKHLDADLVIPTNPIGLVLFVHGSGSSRMSPRNRYVAKVLQSSHVATLLMDLLTEEEDQNPNNRFDIPFLSRRVEQVLRWIQKQDNLKKLPLALFGASTGSAAALIAASSHHEQIRCLVSRGGRPDLAMQSLSQVVCPVLLIVGEKDNEVLTLNRIALDKLGGKKKLEIVQNATHLFEEEGYLEEVARLSATFFSQNL
jgi:pimeloyl-ACP methyl ester carboxylesterase